jgi:hypothetical protein
MNSRNSFIYTTITAIGALIASPSIAIAQSGFTTSGAVQISVGVGGAIPNGFSSEPVSPPNKNMVVFSSNATNLVPNDTNDLADIFQYTPEKGIELVNIVPATGNAPTTGGSFGPAVSPILPDGSYAVAFLSNATDVVPGYQSPFGPTANPTQIYIRLPKTNETLLVSTGIGSSTAAGTFGANANCDQVSITALPNPNRYVVVFRSAAGNLEAPAAASNPSSTVFMAVFVTQNSKTVLSSLSGARRDNGQPFNANLANPVISGNGRFVAFTADGSLADASNSFRQVFLFDRNTQRFGLISKNSSGSPGNGDSTLPSVSFQAERLAFITAASDLVPNPSGATIAIQFDSATRTLTQANTSAAGLRSNGSAYAVRLSPSGKLLALADSGDNLVADTQTNGRIQTYVKDILSGAIIRTSVTTNGSAGDGDSGVLPPSESVPARDALALGGSGFNTPVLYSAFRSSATNLSTLSGSYPNVFQAEISPPKPTLAKGTTIEAPPDVTIDEILPNGKGARVTFVFQEFSDLFAAARRGESSNSVSPLATSLKYNLEVRKVGTKQRIFRTVSRNSTTINKLSPGKYSIRYRVSKTVGKKVIRSGYSAKQSLEVS